VQLEELKLTGLADESVKDEKGRQFNCPHCGAAVTVQLASSKSITCASCNSLIDLSQGTGSELQHAIQDEPLAPLIPLGSMGQLQGAQWQVVGFQHRMGHEAGDDEHFGWSEYLLYNRKRGFTFLVDSQDGWSLVKPVTGAPSQSADGQSATYLGTKYQLKESYEAETNYVAGEFYWQVQRGQTTSNRDYAAGKSLLSMEQGGKEITWSAGNRLESEAVVTAFNLKGQEKLFQRSDVGPFTAASSLGRGTVIVIVLVVLLLMVLLTRCSSNCDPRYENCSSSGSGFRSSGGSWGGSSSGGGHK
jgi:ribosomal protein S27E